MSITKDYLQKFMPAFNSKNANKVLRLNPTIEAQRTEPSEIEIDVYDYNAETVSHLEYKSVQACKKFKNNGRITWINIDGLRKDDVETICKEYNVHPLLVEDILSFGQRPKMDELDNILFCLLNMLYYNTESNCIEIGTGKYCFRKRFCFKLPGRSQP